MSPLELLVTTAFTVLTVAIVIPQAWRLATTRDPSGLSAAGLLNGSVGYTAWVGYLTYQQHWLAMATTALAGVVWIGTTAYVISRLGVSRAAVRFACVYAAALATLALISVPVFGIAISFGAIWAGSPAVREAWTAERISGLSVSGWALYVAEAVSWLAWGLMKPDVVVALYGGIATGIGSAVIAAVVIRVEARRIPALVDDAVGVLDTALDSSLHPEPATA